MSDSGNYTVVAWNEKDRESLTLELVVHDKPDVKIEAEWYYKIGTVRNVSCQVLGHPMPKVKWQFQMCNFTEGERCSENPIETVFVSFSLSLKSFA